MIKYVLCMVYLLFSVSGLILFKFGTMRGGGINIPLVNVTMSWWSLAGVACYGFSFLLYLCVVSKFEVGMIIPILSGIANVLILLASYFILMEHLSVTTIIGAVIVSIGIVIMNLGK